MILINRKPAYIHLTSDDKTLVLTKWNKENVLEYRGSKHIYVKTEEEIAEYYEISEAEHFANESAREAKEMEDENETEE